MPKSIFFSGKGRGFESKSVTDTRATTDKNDPFLNMGFKHGKKWVDKNGAKCNMGFGRITQNTRSTRLALTIKKTGKMVLLCRFSPTFSTTNATWPEETTWFSWAP